MKKLSKSPKKIPKIINFELACHDQVDELKNEISVILKALGHTEALVTDESFVSDFLPFLGSMCRKKAFDKFKKKMEKIGVKVEYTDSIIEIASRIKDKNENSKM